MIFRLIGPQCFYAATTQIKIKICKNISIEFVPSLDEIDAKQWDALVFSSAADATPLLSHAFLSALEHSGSVGQGTGWNPYPLLVKQNKRLIGAMPLYLKSHSYGVSKPQFCGRAS